MKELILRMRIFIFSVLLLIPGCHSLSQEFAPPVSGVPSGKWILMDISEQALSVLSGDSLIRQYPVSTSRFGPGNLENSNQTPLGWHRIRNKIGDNAPLGTIFKARKSTGERAVILIDSIDVPEDLITTRILQLEGCEPGINRGGKYDIYGRCIYIHGTPEEGLIGRPASHGCIRMKNEDIVNLFNCVDLNSFVYIVK